MTSTAIILIAILTLCFVGLGFTLLYLFRFEPNSQLSTLSNTKNNAKPGSELLNNVKNKNRRPPKNAEQTDSGLGAKSKSFKTIDSFEVKLFQAGILSKEDRALFFRRKKISLIITPFLFGSALFFLTGPMFGLVGLCIGIIMGYLYPQSYLNKKIAKRHDECMYYLPLVIEQVSIGVSSALDIGPCIAFVVDMADERGSHNAVTETLVQVQKLMRAGMALHEALIDVGEIVGINEMKNSFMFLAQCAKHGGEVSKQLQELSDSVTLARQILIEAKITALPVKATGALALIFLGFFGMILTGVFVRITTSMG